MHILTDLLHPDLLLSSLATYGTPVIVSIIFLIIFAESGLFFGFFLPGDSLLFTTGLFVALGKLNISILLLIGLLWLAAVAGDSVGYYFGQKFGKRFFNDRQSLLRNPAHLQRAEEFYDKFGRRTIILARFVPAVRTFAPIAAGVSSMNYQTFIVFNLIGGFGWVFAITFLGYYLGKIIPDIDRYILPILLLIIILSAVQPLREALGTPERRRQVKVAMSQLLKR